MGHQATRSKFAYVDISRRLQPSTCTKSYCFQEWHFRERQHKKGSFEKKRYQGAGGGECKGRKARWERLEREHLQLLFTRELAQVLGPTDTACLTVVVWYNLFFVLRKAGCFTAYDFWVQFIPLKMYNTSPGDNSGRASDKLRGSWTRGTTFGIQGIRGSDPP